MIEVENVSYGYRRDAGQNIQNINLKVGRGELILITGKSGSGKTTLFRCINGLIPHFYEGIATGTIRISGQNIQELTLAEIGERVGSVFQDPRSQFFTTDTTDEVAFGCQNIGIPRHDLLNRVEEAFATLGITDLRDRNIFQLSSGERQKIAIASCRAMRPAVYLLDEPSANLDIKSIAQLGKVIEMLKRDGHTVIITEHRLYYLKNLADRVVYMEEGKIAKIYTRRELSFLTAAALNAMGLRQFDLDNAVCRERNGARNEKVRLDVEDLGFTYPPRNGGVKRGTLLKNLSFTAWGGEIIGLIGDNGAGKTTLAKLMVGLLTESSGSIALNRQRLNPRQRLGHTYFVMQDSDYQLFSDSVRTELVLGNEKIEFLEKKMAEVLTDLDLYKYLEKHPAALSRGEKQRLTIGNALIRNAALICFDEPTSGLDGENMNRVSGLLQGLAEQGKLLVIISHDYEFLLHTCNRILHLQAGMIRDDFELGPSTLPKLKQIMLAADTMC